MSKYDLVVKGGEVIDVGTDTIGRYDVAVSGDRIAAVAKDIPETAARQVVRADGAIVTAGLIDIHAHVFEHGTDFGLNPDDAGIHSGCTTLVDQGSCGGWTFDPFKAFIIDRAKTEILLLHFGQPLGDAARLQGRSHHPVPGLRRYRRARALRREVPA